MKKKIIAILLCVVMIALMLPVGEIDAMETERGARPENSILSATSYELKMENVGEGKKVIPVQVKSNTDSVISDELKEIISKKSKSGDGEKIPVSIEFIDGYDENKVDEQAYKMVDISESELMQMQEAIENQQEMMLASGHSIIEAEKASDPSQAALAEKYDAILKARIDIIEAHIQEKTRNFLDAAGILLEEVELRCTLIPLISLAWLTPEKILDLESNELVTHIEYVDPEQKIETYVTDAQTIIGGNVAVNSGYTGSNVKVGVIDGTHPKLSVMGADSANITLTNSGDTGDHPTLVCGVIRKMAPNAPIYTAAALYITEILPAAERLVSNYGVNVINLSAGILSSTGVYNAYSRGVDEFIRRTKCTMCIAAGNPESEGQTVNNMYINQFGLAPNAITVGAVTRSGTNPGARGAYTVASYSMYREAAGTVNKPDVCAPGNLTIYGYSRQGTSFSTPLVTGTVIQMMARNVGLKDKPQTLKAALMASASYNGGSSMSYVSRSRASNQEGAGVIDAGFCFQVAQNGRRCHFDATSSSNSFSYDVYCDSTTIPFRIACAWEVVSDSTSTSITDYDMQVFKNGVMVAHSLAFANSSTSPNTNYEIVEISPATLSEYGAGYYEVVISKAGTYNGSGSVRIGLAWEQR